MDFPGNSNKEKEKQEKKIEKVITGEAVRKTPSVGRRFKNLFFNGEFKGAAKYIVSEVMLPALKNVIVDATSKGIERIVYGDLGSRRRSSWDPRMDPRRSIYSYNRPIDRPTDRPMGRPAMLPDQPPHFSQRRPDSREIILTSRGDAERVLEVLTEIVDTYGQASIADLHDLVGFPTTHVDNKWGWTALGRSGIIQVREGYLIDLPHVEPISA